MKKITGFLVGLTLTLSTINSSAQVSGLDSTFSEDGIQITQFGVGVYGDAWLNAAALEPDGKIVVTGQLNTSEYNDLAIGRYNSDGTLDSAFGIDGVIPVIAGEGKAIVVQADGKIVAVGNSVNDLIIVRYNHNGTPDSTFNHDGIQITDIVAGNSDEPHSVVIQPDGKIVVGGRSGNGLTGYDFAILRYKTDGTLDSTFSGDGIQITDLGAYYDEGTSIAIQADGKIVMVGGTNSGAEFAAVRYNADGTLDSSFNMDTINRLDVGMATSVAIQSDGKIVMSANAGIGSALLRFNSNGSIDSTFGMSGIQITAIEGFTNSADAMLIQPDGKMIVAGTSLTFVAETADFTLARYNSDGTPDRTFGGEGLETIVVSEDADYAHAVMIQSDGKIVVAGSTLYGGDWGFAIARYNNINTSPCIADYTTVYDDVTNTYALTLDTATTTAPVAYKWTFGDGTSSTLTTPSHTYIDTLHFHNICLTVYFTSGDSCGFCQVLSGNPGYTINVFKAPVVCTASYTTVYDSTLNLFTITVDSATIATATSYNWDFGDGSTSTLAAPSHVYAVDSLYNVCMEVVYSPGYSCTYCHTIGIDSAGNIIRDGGFTLNVHSATTAISENNTNEIAVTIYPNPNTGIFQLIFNSQTQSNTQLSIYNVIGEKVYSRDSKQLTNATNVDLSDQPNGIYFIQLNTGNNTITKKIIINR